MVALIGCEWMSVTLVLKTHPPGLGDSPIRPVRAGRPPFSSFGLVSTIVSASGRSPLVLTARRTFSDLDNLDGTSSLKIRSRNSVNSSRFAGSTWGQVEWEGTAM